MRFALVLVALMLAAGPGAAQVVIGARPVVSTPTPPPMVVKAPPTFASSGLGVGGLISTLRPLGGPGGPYGLSPAGDPQPQCRATCAKARLYCAGDDGECAEQARQCRVACAQNR